MRCNTPISFRPRPRFPLRCFPSWLILSMRAMMNLLNGLSGYYSPSIPNTIGSNLQLNITQQLLSTLSQSSWTDRRSSVSNPVVHAMINPIILASVRVLMSSTWPRTRKSETIPRPCRFCSRSPICFLSHASLKKFWNISSFRKILLGAGKIHGTFMQILL